MPNGDKELRTPGHRTSGDRSWPVGGRNLWHVALGPVRVARPEHSLAVPNARPDCPRSLGHRFVFRRFRAKRTSLMPKNSDA